jgi:hypothetical protein
MKSFTVRAAARPQDLANVKSGSEDAIDERTQPIKSIRRDDADNDPLDGRQGYRTVCSDSSGGYLVDLRIGMRPVWGQSGVPFGAEDF